MGFEERLADAVIEKLDMTKIGESVFAEIERDSKFYATVQRRLSDQIGGYGRANGMLESVIVDRLADKWVMDNAQAVFAKLDVQAILNAVTIKAVGSLSNRVRE